MRGNVTQRGKHSWRIKFTLPPDVDGRSAPAYRDRQGQPASSSTAAGPNC